MDGRIEKSNSEAIITLPSAQHCHITMLISRKNVSDERPAFRDSKSGNPGSPVPDEVLPVSRDDKFTPDTLPPALFIELKQCLWMIYALIIRLIMRDM